MICPHCGMYMKPFNDGSCEFCGEDVRKPKSVEKETLEDSNK